MRALPVLLIAALSVSGCARLADSRLNPLNWFGGGGGAVAADPNTPPPELVPSGARTLVVDARQPVAEITAVRFDRTPDGAILTATGTASSQGWFNAELVLVAIESGVATYAFRAEPPRGPAATGSTASRRITAAVNLTVEDLAVSRAFRVQGASNSRSVGR